MKKILVVDDDADILTVMEILLTMHGYSVESTPRWEEAIDKALCFEPDIILLDIYFCGKDGRIICKELKSMEATKHIPVILISARQNLEIDLKGCLADDFITKPFEVKHLLMKVRSHLYTSEIITTNV